MDFMNGYIFQVKQNQNSYSNLLKKAIEHDAKKTVKVDKTTLAINNIDIKKKKIQKKNKHI